MSWKRRDSRLTTLDVACGDVRNQPQDGVLEVFPFERIPTAQTALLRVDGLGGVIFFGPLEGDESSTANATMDFERAAGVG